MRLILFDVDGTLVDSQELIVASMSQGFKAAGLAPPPREAILSIVGLSLPLAIGVLLDENPESPIVLTVAEAYREAHRQLRSGALNEAPLFAGARETVISLAKEPATILGVATGKGRSGLQSMLAATGLEPYFATKQTADDAPSKPHPAMILQAIAETGVERRNTIMIGDSVYDMEMARAADVRGIGVSWGYCPVATLEAAGAHVIASNFEELRRLLETEIAG